MTNTNTNTNTTTGLPYGVISGQNLHPDVAHMLWERAYDICAEAAYQEVLDTWHRAAVAHVSVGGDPEDYDEDWVALHIAEEMDGWTCDEPCAQVEYDGVNVVVSHLGGAMLVTSIDGPISGFRSWCSPCVPGAVDMDSGCGSLEAHGVPADWLPGEGA